MTNSNKIITISGLSACGKKKGKRRHYRYPVKLKSAWHFNVFIFQAFKRHILAVIDTKLQYHDVVSLIGLQTHSLFFIKPVSAKSTSV